MQMGSPQAGGRPLPGAHVPGLWSFRLVRRPLLRLLRSDPAGNL